MSSMQSAPATIPATSAGTFTAALAPVDPGTVTVEATNSGSWQDSASASLRPRSSRDKPPFGS